MGESTGSSFGFILVLLAIVIFILAIRLFGAWMLRIDEIIKHQKRMLEEMKKITSDSINKKRVSFYCLLYQRQENTSRS